MRVFRCGSRLERYGGARKLAGVYAEQGRVDTPWQWPQCTVDIPQSAPAGAYVAVLDDQTKLDSRCARALFVVRPQVVRAPLLVVLPLFTYQAYNVAHVDGTRGGDEGECLYSGASWVTLHRPGGGIGGHPWDEVNRDEYDRDSPRQTFAHWDAKALAWLERAGYEYECCTDLELHEGTVQLERYAAVASFGHHEYWTAQMRDRVQRYLDDGGAVAFFGGNTLWFSAEYDPARKALRRAGRWTQRPEWQLTGVSYAFGGGKWIGSRPPTGYRVRAASHWAFARSGLCDGEVFGVDERLIGYECDGVAPHSDLSVLADASIRHWHVEDGSGEVSPSAQASLGVRGPHENVFTASTVDWARVLYAGQPLVGAITSNVLNRYIQAGPRYSEVHRERATR